MSRESKRRKRGVSLLLSILLILVTITGCGKNSEQTQTEGNESKAMGRYMESEIVLPEEYQGSDMLSMKINEEGNLETIFFMEEGMIKLTYKEQEGSWETENLEWTNSICEKGNVIDQVVYGEDGTLYVVTYNSDEAGDIHYSIFKQQGQEAKQIEIPGLEEKVEIYEGYTTYPFVTQLQVREDGTLVISGLLNDSIQLISQESGEEIQEVEASAPFCVVGNEIYASKTDGTGIECISDTGEIQEICDAEINLDNAILAEGDKDLYLIDANGIAEEQTGGTIWQELVDGSLTSLCDADFVYSGFARRTLEDGYEQFFVSGMLSYSEAKIFSYTYDPEVASVPEHELTIYSLIENNTIKQAITAYQSEHTDVKLNYVVAMQDGDNNATSDIIRSLNTEIMAGNGADILLLDGLPAESYIEKGVLLNLQDIIQPMVDEGEILPNVIENYNTEDGCYYVPIRIQVPIFYGPEEKIDALKNLDHLASYLADHSGDELINQLGGTNLATTLFLLNYSEMIGQDKTLEEDEFENYLELCQKMAENYTEEEASVFNSNWDSAMLYDLSEGSDFYQKDPTDQMLKISQLTGLVSFYFAAAGIEEAGYTYDTMDGKYVENGLVGINASSKNQEIAKDFLTTLLSEKVQRGENDDGFPVNEKALESVLLNRDTNIDAVMEICMDTGESYSYDEPSEELRQDLYQKIESVSTPITYDKVLTDMVVEEAVQCLSGQQTVEETVENAISQINLYLSE